jgi:hypothetical protein
MFSKFFQNGTISLSKIHEFRNIMVPLVHESTDSRKGHGTKKTGLNKMLVSVFVPKVYFWTMFLIYIRFWYTRCVQIDLIHFILQSDSQKH